MKFRARWTWPWGPPFVVRINLFSPLFQLPLFFPTTPFADRVVDGLAPCQIAAMVAIILSAYHRVTPSLLFPSLFPPFSTLLAVHNFFYPGS